MTESVSRARRAAPRRTLRRAGVATGGAVTVLLGLVLIPLPGPGTVIVLAGLTVMRKEFPAAGRAADRMKDVVAGAVARLRRTPRSADQVVPS